MSIPQLERNFVKTFMSRCSNVTWSRIESATSVGFPDLVGIWSGRPRLIEAKVIHAGNWIYVRNTQVAWCYKALMHGYDTPFALGMAGQGLGMFRFSHLTETQHQDYKNTHKRYKLEYLQSHVQRVGKYEDWETFVVSRVFT